MTAEMDYLWQTLPGMRVWGISPGGYHMLSVVTSLRWVCYTTSHIRLQAKILLCCLRKELQKLQEKMMLLRNLLSDQTKYRRS